MEHKPAPQSFALDSETAHAILDSALDAHILMSHTGTIVGWNPQSDRIFGWQAEEVLGRRLSDVIIPPIYREAHERGIRTFQETGRGAVLGKRIEIEGLHRDQRLFPIELTVTSVETPGGLVFSAFIRDITARKEAEQSLKEAKERAEQAARDRAGILAAVDVFFIYVDSNGLVTEWTAMAEQTFSLSRNAVLGRRLTDLPIPWNWSEVVGMMRGPGERKKVPLRQGDGAERLIGMTVTSTQHVRGPFSGCHVIAAVAKRRVGDLKHLCSHTQVLGYDGGDSSHRWTAGVQFVHKLLMQARQCGHRAQTGHEVSQLLIGQQALQIAHTRNPGFERIRSARLSEILMRRPTRFVNHETIRLAGQHDTHDMRIPALHFLQQFRSVHARHAHVGHHDVVRCPREEVQGFDATRHELHVPFSAHGTKHAL